MTLKAFFWSFIFLFSPCLQLGAYATTSSPKLEALLKKSSERDSFRCSFQQEFYSVLRDQSTLSTGTLSVKAPASFKFEMLSPKKELYLSNGKDIWKYVPDFKHAQHLSANLEDLYFLQILTNPATLTRYYQVSDWTPTTEHPLSQDQKLPEVKSDMPPSAQKNLLYVKLEPKGDKKQKVLYLALNTQTALVQELRIVQLNGNRTRLLFSNCSETPLPQSLFQFSPPEGIVVENQK